MKKTLAVSVLSFILCFNLFAATAFAQEQLWPEQGLFATQEEAPEPQEEDFEVLSEELFEEEELQAAAMTDATEGENATVIIDTGKTALYSVTLKYSSKTYTGKAVTQTGTTVVKALVNGKEKVLTRGTDYTISYKNNVNAGTATLIATGKGNYTGTIEKTFKIKPVALESVTLKYKYKVYNGETRTQTGATVVKAVVDGKTKTLKNNSDYKITYQNNKNVGKATMIVTGKGNYTGTIKKTFYIYPQITTEWIYVPNYKYNEQGGFWETGHYLKITAKQGSEVLWTRNSGKEVVAQLSGIGTIGYKASGLYYYYSKGKVFALDILTGKTKWTCDSLVGSGVSGVLTTNGNLYIIKQSNPNSDSSKALLYVIDKNGKILKTINWSDNGKYTGTTSGGASVQRMENGNIVMGVELSSQYFTYKEIHIDPKTGKIVKVCDPAY